MRLLRTELRRLFTRRLTWATLIAVVLLLGLLQIETNRALTPPTPAEIAQAEQDFQRYVADWEANHTEWEAECQRSGQAAEECVTPRPTAADWGLAAQPFDQVVEAPLQFGVYLGGLALFVIAASFVGAEFTSGAITNWLTFVPQRGRVYASKLLAVVLGSLAVALALDVVGVGATAVLGVVHGSDVGLARPILEQAGRGLAVVTVFGVIGFVLALIGRHTVAALGVFLAYGFVAFIRTSLLSGQAWAQRLTRFTPEGNILALLSGRFEYEIPVAPPPGAEQDYTYLTEVITAGQASIYFAVVLAVLITVGAVVFSRRDVA